MRGPEAAALCPRCRKPPALCVCPAIRPLDTRTALLILQHPQEQDRELGTAWLAAQQFRKARLVVGLSWPGLAAALGRPAQPRHWGVLHLGAARPAPAAGGAALGVLGAAGETSPARGARAALAGLAGIVLLDGSWSQAKALWWRNPWLLKLRRLVLAPPARSLYGALRREPRGEALSTIEAAALALAELEGDPALPPRALAPFRLLLERYAAMRPPAPLQRAPDRRAPDRRRTRRGDH